MQADGQTIASRKASQLAIEAFAPLLPELVGGSADLAHSNLTLWKASKSVATDDPNANYVYYGVREFGMTAIANGLALHGGFIPFDATFLVFSDYARNGVRMSALIPAHAIHVYTHDSIGLGEDGPTHQPVEHLASLRYIPNNDVWRPCDAVESAVSWKSAITRTDGPSCLVFSRQNLPHQPRSTEQVAQIARGGYVLADAEGGVPDVILIGTGSKWVWPWPPRPSWMPPGSRPAWCPCRPPTCSSARTRPTASPCCPTPCASAWRWKRALPVSGASTWAWTVR